MVQIYVSTHSRPKAAGYLTFVFTMLFPFQLTAARRRLAALSASNPALMRVSTHSRPKAAGNPRSPCSPRSPRFNSQPPEGGWPPTTALWKMPSKFQLTAARRRLGGQTVLKPEWVEFQLTAARRRLAPLVEKGSCFEYVSTHSRPKAAGRQLALNQKNEEVSTHSRPKAAGR